MTVDEFSVVYVMPDKMGGVFSLNKNLVEYGGQKAAGRYRQTVVLTDEAGSRDVRSSRQIRDCLTTLFPYSARENLHAVIKRLHRCIPNEPGVLVSNDTLELALLCRYDLQRLVVHIVHNNYNFHVACLYAQVIDVFVVYSRLHYERLCATFPSRTGDIIYLPYGVPLSSTVRQPTTCPLRLLFAGRVVEPKGIFDLPQIDQLLHAAHVNVEWTIIGDGPDRPALYEQWHAPHVQYLGLQTSDFVLEQCSRHDLFIFPSRSEGFPVALLEAMAAGLVPISSDLPSGVPEVVTEATGFRLPIGSVADFAAAIIEMDRDRARLEQLSRACRHVIEGRFDIRQRVADYQALFEQYSALRRTRSKTVPLPSHSRLDQPWLPNWLVIAARRLRGRIR